MTYGEVKHSTLKLIFSDTSAGQPIAESYNDQADYIAAIPALVDSAQTDIAVRARQIPAVIALSALGGEEDGGFTAYTLPADCREIVHSGLVVKEGETVRRYGGYRLIGGKLYVPKSAPGGMELEYYRCPVSVGADPADGLILDNSPDTHSAIPYFVAAQLVMYDDAFRYGALRSEYEARVAALRRPVSVERSTIDDVYAFALWGEGEG